MAEEDQAQKIELMQWELNNASRPPEKTYTPSEAGYGPEDCDQCLGVMPAKRREYGFRVCVHCKTAAEEKGKRYARV